ncbi:MAG: DUF692 domain-containing protein [Flavobacteriales bacterium]|nr:DUF692 domain-containing protein [Flavobacteriales bacterium]
MIGLGFRRDLAEEMIAYKGDAFDFVELAPENWMNLGGYWKTQLDQIAERYPIFCHGLSLSIGSPDKLDYAFLKELKVFLDRYQVKTYSEHLSYSKCDNAHLYDLLPIPFRQDAVNHIVSRIKEVQEMLERPLIIENVSYYTSVAAEMEEHEFISQIVTNANCKLLLDVNNVYVNSFNHGYSSKEFILQLPLNHVEYIHMAGHEKISDDLIIDTHGQDIIDPVFELFEWTSRQISPVPVLLERDFNIPELPFLEKELGQLKSITSKAWKKQPVR